MYKLLKRGKLTGRAESNRGHPIKHEEGLENSVTTPTEKWGKIDL